MGLIFTVCTYKKSSCDVEIFWRKGTIIDVHYLKTTKIITSDDVECNPETSMDSMHLFAKSRKNQSNGLESENIVTCENNPEQPTKRFSIKELVGLGYQSRKSSESTFQCKYLKKESTTGSAFSESKSNKRQSTINSTYKSVTSTYAPVPATEIIPGKLYVGTWDDAKSESELLDRGLTHVLCLIGPKHLIKGTEHKHVPMNDRGRTDLKIVLDKVYEFMEESQQVGKSLFVHCQSGQNRSATIVIAFLMMSKGLTLYRAHKKLKELRPIVHINVNYAKQLLDLERQLYKETSLPDNWMELSHLDLMTGDVFYQCERLDSNEQDQFKKTQQELQLDLKKKP